MHPWQCTYMYVPPGNCSDNLATTPTVRPIVYIGPLITESMPDLKTHLPTLVFQPYM